MTEIKKGECEHVNIEREGLWDGKNDKGEPIGGPIILCADCGQKVYMSWETFKSIPRNDLR